MAEKKQVQVQFEQEKIRNNEENDQINQEIKAFDNYNEISMKRRAVRIISRILISFLILLLVFIFSNIDEKRSTWKSEAIANKNLIIDIQNCQIHLTQSTENDKIISASYLLKAQGIFLQMSDRDPIEYRSANDTYSIRMINEIPNVKYCWLELSIPNNFEFANITAFCHENSKCFLTQGNGKLIAQNINMTGDENSQFNLNLMNIQADRIIYNGANGHVYLGTFKLNGVRQNENDFQCLIDLLNGEVVLQSVYNYQLNFSIPGQTVCMSAPKFQFENSQFLNRKFTSKSFENCSLHYVPNQQQGLGLNESLIGIDGEYINQNSGRDIGIANLKEHICKGQVNLLGGKIDEYAKSINNEGEQVNLTQFLKVSVLSGNILANIINQEEGIADFQAKNFQNVTHNVLKGEIFNRGLGFDIGLRQQLESYKNDPSGSKLPGDQIEIITLGKYQLQMPNFMKFVRSSNPSYAQLRPWWLSIASASLINPPTFSGKYQQYRRLKKIFLFFFIQHFFS